MVTERPVNGNGVSKTWLLGVVASVLIAVLGGMAASEHAERVALKADFDQHKDAQAKGDRELAEKLGQIATDVAWIKRQLEDARGK